MKILITGANGFIGSHLVRTLSQTHEVIAGIRSGTKSTGFSSTRKVPDLNEESNWQNLLEDIDVVVHLAARVHVMHEDAEDPLKEFREVNTLGTLRLAEAAIAQGVKRFIFFSTIKVNGEGDTNTPYSEQSIASPVDPYGISKWEAEKSLTALAKESSMDVVILRSPVVYGPGVKGNIERIAKLVNSGLPLPFSKVNNRRTMLSLENLSIWVEKAISSKEIPSRPVLMGDPEPVSTKDLVNYLGIGMGKKPFMIPIPIAAMELAAKLIGKEQVTQRLFSNLEIIPSFAAYPGLPGELQDPYRSLRKLGGTYKAR